MRRTKKALAVLALLVCAGCQGGMIRADAVDGLIRTVGARHDAYVTTDAALNEGERETYLRSTALLYRLLDEAKK